jgi:hypothetical protein
MATEATRHRQLNQLRERERANTRRLLHDFAVYCIWHLSVTKPDSISLRILVNEMMGEWAEDFTCGNERCSYCVATRKSQFSFRAMYRNLMGRKETGKRG